MFSHPILRNRLIQAGAAVLTCFALLSIGAPLLTQLHLLKDPVQQEVAGLDANGMPLAPCAGSWLGTDQLGRDVLSRVIHGGRVSLSLGVASMLIATAIGVSVGLLSGYYEGKLDLLLMRFTEMNLTIPAILLAIAFASSMDGRVVHLHPAGWSWHALDLRLERGVTSLFVLIGFVCWPGMVRVIRAQVLSLKESEFVLASRVLGATDAHIIFTHILPGVLPNVIVLAAMTTASTIALEAGLGYLGVGVPPPLPSWGAMIAEGQDYFLAAPVLVIAPGLAIVITVLALNLLGQGLQETLHPPQR